jgi:hypothetical protein
MIEQFMVGLREKMEEPLGAVDVPVLLPEELDPMERHYRYAMHLDAELRLAGIGTAGGGTYLIEEDEDGEITREYCVVDTDATDIAAARAVLRLHLPELGCPSGTLIQYGELEDRYDGSRWHLGEPKSISEDWI